CIAGAGSGKTTVLTKRIEFLIKYRGVDPSKILAITFTRKARQEMISRLPDSNVMIETFNSFCEKILRLHNDKIYGREVKVISYRDKITIINRALSMLKLNMARAIDIYFTYAQKRSKTPEQLARVFLNDCFFVRDYFKFKNKRIEQSAFQGDEHKDSANLMFGVCNYIEAFMKKNGLRDFADQLIDAIAFLEANPSFIPKFSHVLIDEYQDVNSTQIKLVDLLKVENIFCVGDPRQSIYGWRGSDIKYILNFEDKYKGCSVITLTKNYRSTKHIVSLINKSISKMGLADLESALAGEKEIQLIKFISEGAEFEFVAQGILASKLPREEIFVLARTNRQLNDLSTLLLSRGIKHIKRSDEMKASVVALKGDVTLATIHAIKGLEAEMVFIVGCNSLSFPCKGSEHPVIEMIKIDEYDKEEEERRLFYVAMSRAKRKLVMTHSGKPTYFITDEMLSLLNSAEVAPRAQAKGGDVIMRLREWRTQMSRNHNVSAFMIMHDKTMIEIAQKRPATLDELGEVYGMGPTKVMKYGDEILDIVLG
ncbi:MAG: ATP-dependent DNA helicase UvrD2, partial [Nanoarchaeota archaeon]|nr:ATP-dependent DNA helicase UvrD2 [Nanoarchaeota archaeon]